MDTALLSETVVSSVLSPFLPNPQRLDVSVLEAMAVCCSVSIL